MFYVKFIEEFTRRKIEEFQIQNKFQIDEIILQPARGLQHQKEPAPTDRLHAIPISPN